MKLSLNWIKDFVQIPENISPKELGSLVTLHTAEVEEVIVQEKAFNNMFVGQIMSMKKHPGADKLTLCEVALGEHTPDNADTVQIVCGGSNLEEGLKIAVAIPGSIVSWHGGETMELKKAKIRGESSYGMICAGEEIGLAEYHEQFTKDPESILPLSHLEVPAGTPLAKALGLNDIILDIDNKSLTHRPDLWGHYGMAREISAIFKKPLKFIKEHIPSLGWNELENGKWNAAPDSGKLDISEEADIQIQIKDSAISPRFSACIIKGIEVGPSPRWMQERLEAAGMNAINNIVDITNYVMLEMGQPMHAYDRQQVGSDKLVIDWGKEGVKLTTLEGEERELHTEDPVIYNAEGEPLIIAGIKGGLKSGIHDETTEIILEAANWEPIMIRKASARHALRTDASQRFEKSLDPALTPVAIHRAIALIKELCPDAKVISQVKTEGIWVNPQLSLTTTPARVNSRIGKEIALEEMHEILKALEFEVEEKPSKNSGEKTLHITVPSHRATRDVDIEEDIVEEIARIHGYDKIEGKVPSLPMKLPTPNYERRHKHEARRILAYQQGFTEVMNYSFYGKDRLEACGLNEEEHIKVLNYLSEDQTHMRVSMTPNMLASIAKNAREFSEMRLFEIGRTYKEVGEYMPLEQKKIIGAISALKPKGNWQEKELFYQAKGELEFFLKQFRTGKHKFKPSQTPPPYAHPKKCIDVVVRGKLVGYVFTVHPGVLKAFDIAHDVAIFALRFQDLIAHGRNLQDFTAPSKFPGMELDVSILTSSKTEIGKLEKTIKNADKNKLITNIELKDVYEGEHVPDGQKSVLFSVQMGSSERTLKDTEFHTLQEAIFLALEAGGATIRGRE
jgi:phenylalanyl-tRNA synthetase beta chain